MHDPIDLYCERTSPDLWAEPVNALTNLAFLLASTLLLRHWLVCYRARPAAGWDRLLLVTLVGLIGVGSGLFHTFAQTWAAAADALPIAMFISVFLLVSLKRLAGLGWAATLTWFVVYHLANWAAKTWLPAELLNGSVYYLPSWVALLAMAGWLTWCRHPRAALFAGGAVLFLVSLGFRSVDLALCAAWPLGTHFLWHLLNATLLWLLTRAVMDAPHVTQPSRNG